MKPFPEPCMCGAYDCTSCRGKGADIEEEEELPEDICPECEEKMVVSGKRMDVMNAKEIIITKLKEMGCDGLCNPDQECGCGIDNLFPCDSCMAECGPAWRHEIMDSDGGPWPVYFNYPRGDPSCDCNRCKDARTDHGTETS